MAKVYISIIGAGGVGRAFLRQLFNYIASNKSAPHTLVPIAVSRSSKAVISTDYSPIPLSSILEDLDKSVTKPLAVPDETISYLKAAPGEVILVDNTSDETLASLYPQFLKNGIHIATPNKKAFSSDISLWDSTFAAARGPQNPNGGFVFHEATVGAGLPVLSTLKDLVETGDKVRKIEGVFSGTMSFLFNTFAPVGSSSNAKFSEVVVKARDLGYTEPDPRDDLNGLDVARKLTILARLSGLLVPSPTSFPIQSLIPKPLETAATAEEFLNGLGDYDAEMENLKKDAESKGKTIRYVGKLDVETGKVEVGLDTFDTSHPIAGLRGSDNIISFYTERYGERALIVQGAGAGADVTAMGVLGDVIKILQRLK
ncbi:homoserine dehydrogenase-domain-containing protein [Kalaharituber pfeilii]|nr:homoserine dehydrogenase-domain-containing protein [Kalaharituber pfeilii]